MITIGMNYSVLPGKEDVFERAFSQVLNAMEAFPGHTKSHLYKEVVSSSSSYLILSEWNDQKDFDSFIRSEAFSRVTNWGKEQILAGRPKHQTFSVST